MTLTIHKFGCIWTVCNLTKYDFGLHFYKFLLSCLFDNWRKTLFAITALWISNIII